MRENTNRAIAYNSFVLYVKMAISTVCALLATRFSLQALGIVDFGLYAVLGGIISFVSIFNTIMLSTSNRFIAVAVGKGNTDEANKQFNVNLIIHVAIALFALLIAYPVGYWYIPRFVNYDGSISDAMMVYSISIIGCVFSFVGVPYNGLLMAKERFIVFSLIDVFIQVFKLIIAWLLVYHFEHKLIVFTVAMALSTAAPTFIYYIYCSRNFKDIVRLRIVRDRTMYKNVFNFSAWVGVGAIAHVGREQGAALVVNAFFNTVMNTAMGIAASINSYISLFAQNVTQPMAPQITKSYASNNFQRTNELLIMSTKYSFLLMFLISSFFLVEPDWLLGIWLGEVPPYATIFLILFIVNNLVQSVNSGIGNIIFASGKIAVYQIIVSVSNILSVVAGYFVLKGGADAYYLLVAYIIVSIFRFFAIQWTLHITLHYDTSVLIKQSYIPSLLVSLLFCPVFFIPSIIHPLIKFILCFVYLCLIEWFVGLNKEERNKLITFIKSKK